MLSLETYSKLKWQKRFEAQNNRMKIFDKTARVLIDLFVQNSYFRINIDGKIMPILVRIHNYITRKEGNGNEHT